VSTDYDAPRNLVESDQDDATVTNLKIRRTQRRSGATDIGEPVVAVSYYCADLDVIDESGGELTLPVLPKQDDEFACTSCFLVQRRHLLSRTRGHETICRDCA
jgi:hypothetical protein